MDLATAHGLLKRNDSHDNGNAKRPCHLGALGGEGGRLWEKSRTHFCEKLFHSGLLPETRESFLGFLAKDELCSSPGSSSVTKK
jgi:hypothetical protein